MVIAHDFKKDFYEIIQHERVLVLVAFDVDALCACRILQYLFQCDHVRYTIVPVTGMHELKRAYEDNCEGVQRVVLVNCGATVDVVDLLQPDPSVIFYICDNHRPVDVHNVYNQIQVQLLMRTAELQDVPEFEKVFRDSESEEEDDDDSDTEPGEKRRRPTEEVLAKRIEKKEWIKEMQQTIFAYTEFAEYGTSSALLIYELAWKMSKDTNDLLWLAIIGVTEMYSNHKGDRDKYMEDVTELQSHMLRLNRRATDDDENAPSVDCLKVTFDEELQLVLYRHWSLFDSICHSEYLSSKFKLWTLKGKKRLHEFLADMGIPLVQCRQKFVAMDVNYKEEIKDMIRKFLDKYGLSEADMFLPSFHVTYGYKNKYCAEDVVRAAQAVLEGIDKDRSPSDSFLKALDVLNRNKTDDLEKAIERAKLQRMAVVNQVQGFLDMNQVISAGPFLYALPTEGTPDVRFFSKPMCLDRLARFTLQAYASVSKLKKARNLPLVVATPLESEDQGGTMLVVGVPPLSDNSCRNCFGKAFEQAARNTNSRTLHDHFDTHYMEIKKEDKGKFFDALVTLLED